MSPVSMDEQWVVVGGGMMGLTAALHLARAGHRTIVVEGGPQLGGLAESCSLGDIRWDRFYHVILSSDQHLLGLLAELDLERHVRFRRTRTGIHIGGRLQGISTPWELLSCRDIPLGARLGLGRAVLASTARTSVADLDAETAVRWLTRHSGKKAVDVVWRPLLRSKLGRGAEDASALFIWSTLRRLYGVGAGRLGSGQFGYVEGGYGRIIAALKTRLVQLGVNIRCDWPVTGIRRSGRRHVLSGPDRAELQADRVLLTIPGPLVARICNDLADTERERLEGIGFIGVICLSLLLDRPLTDFYITNLVDGNETLTGIVEMTNLLEPGSFGGRHLVYLPLYLPSDDTRFAQDDRAIIEVFRAALAKLLPGFSNERILAARVSRATNVLAAPVVGRVGGIQNIRTTVPGLHVLNSEQIIGGTLNVNETVRHAEEGMARLFHDTPQRGAALPAVALWSRLAPWEDRLAELESDLLVRGLLSHRLLPGPADEVLDVGCGPGFTAERLTDRVHRYVGLDVSIPALACARRRVGAARNVTFLPLDHRAPERLDVVQGQKFTLILCNSVIQYLPDIAAVRSVFRAFRGVAADSACIVIGDIPVRRRFIREALFAWWQGALSGFPLQVLTGLFRRAVRQHVSASRAERPVIFDAAELSETARKTGYRVDVLPAPNRPSGNRVLLVCRPAREAERS